MHYLDVFDDFLTSDVISSKSNNMNIKNVHSSNESVAIHSTLKKNANTIYDGLLSRRNIIAASSNPTFSGFTQIKRESMRCQNECNSRPTTLYPHIAWYDTSRNEKHEQNSPAHYNYFCPTKKSC